MSVSAFVISVALVVTLLVSVVILLALFVMFVLAVARLLVSVVILLALVVIFVLLAAISPSMVTVQTLGLPLIKTYNLLLSFVSYHKLPTGSVTAGSASCLNTLGLPAMLFALPVMFVVFVVTVDVKLV